MPLAFVEVLMVKYLEKIPVLRAVTFFFRTYTGGSRISEKGVDMYKVGGRFADFMSFFHKYLMKMK